MKLFKEDSVLNSLWRKSLPIYDAVLQLPFIKELKNGSLDIQKFCFYLEQDHYYLAHFTQAMKIIAARTHHLHLGEHLNYLANVTVALEEQQIHAYYYKQFNYQLTQRITRACLHYCDFLIAAAASESTDVALAAILPCFILYYEVSCHLVEQVNLEHHPYRHWLETYAGEQFIKDIHETINLFDICLNMQHFSKVEKAFITSMQHEWYFWHDAYEMNCWETISPVIYSSFA